MKSLRLSLLVVPTLTLLHAAVAAGAHIDMSDPRRALGREDDVRIDAQLVQDTVSSGSPVGVTVRIQNLSQHAIAIADKNCDISYDIQSQTITVSVGSEVPKNGELPHLVIVRAGEQRTFAAGAILHVAIPAARSRFVATPRLVEIKVNILRDLAPFQQLIDGQARASAPVTLTDQQFDQWLESNDTIFLNAIPVRYTSNGRDAMNDASQRKGGGEF